MAAVRKMTNAMFSMPNLATPMARTGAEPGSNAGYADKIAGLDKRADPPDEAGEGDSSEAHLDRILGHQDNTQRQRYRHCSGYDACLEVTGKIFRLKSC